MSRSVSPQQAREALHSGGEVAFLDLREPGPFSMGHPLFAVPCPYSSLELRVPSLVPRLGVNVLLLDDNDGIAAAAADVLARMGYSDVAVVEGGARGWAEAGYVLYKGVNVPSKTLGELAEHAWQPKTIDAQTLRDWQEKGKEFRFFDCRPSGEYAKMTVPGATCLPNGEIAHRLPRLPDDAPILLTCAGRTRGLIGALSLGRVAPEREIFALENGTQGWALAGFELARGNDPAALPKLDADAAATTRARAEAFLAGEEIPTATASDVRAFLDDGSRTTFLIDVRSEQEALDDGLPGFVQALSGQLVQATDQWIGVRHSRIVLADDLGLRAGIAAWWLRMLGYDPVVALIDDELRALEPPERPVPVIPSAVSVAASDALGAVRSGRGRFIDLRGSEEYRREHVAGAVWSIRSRLDRISASPVTTLYLIGDGTPRSHLAAADLARHRHPRVALVEGGIAALRAAGASIETGGREPRLRDALDITWFAHGRHDGDLEASRTYLEWEQGLVGQLDPVERSEFKL